MRSPGSSFLFNLDILLANIHCNVNQEVEQEELILLAANLTTFYNHL